MSNVISFKQKEAKTITFSVKEDGKPIDLNGSTLFFGALKKGSNDRVIEKNDVDFDKTQADSGVVSVFLNSNNLDLNGGEYIGELKITFPDTSICKSADILMSIERAVTP